MPMVWLDGWQKMGNIKTKRSAVSTPFFDTNKKTDTRPGIGFTWCARRYVTL